MAYVFIAIAIGIVVVTITTYLMSRNITRRKYDIFRMIRITLRELFLNAINFRKKYTDKSDITGKVVVITGANTGIGFVTALEMAKRNAIVIIGCRDIDKANKAIEDIKQQYKNANIRQIKLDLSSLKSVRQFAKQVSDEEKQIDILINNAGVMACPKWTTEDGFEMQFATNHLGHFLLTMLLLDRIKAAPKARIVIVSGNAHIMGNINFDDINLDNDYAPINAYTQSLLANVLFARELSNRLSATNINTYSLHPGVIKTELSRHFGFFKSLFGRIYRYLFWITPELGAQTTLYCALDNSVANESGYYYDDCQRVNTMASNVSDVTAKKLWDLSCNLVKLEDRLRLN